ncbi:MAG: hypothetical protein EOO24_39545 [Comamonadaceae bacterium]|nr:MAG: hypothetical protein EOO24_39545 [Comamonadaceae bacterium]
MPVSQRTPFVLALTAVGAAAFLVACGGSGNDDPTPTPTTAVSGTVVKGPVSGAEVCAYRATSSGKGQEIACVTSSATGSYSMELDYQGDVVIEASGGSYTDEATNTSKRLTTPMQVVVRAAGTSVVGMVTPLTSVAYSVARNGSGGLTSTSFGTASAGVATSFQLTGVNLATTAPVVTGTANAYGRILRAVSQFNANGGSLATFQAYANPTSFQVAFSSAYAAINGTSITFTLGTPTTPTNPGGTQSCGITVSGSGTVTASGTQVPFTLPPTKICVTGLPANSCSAGNSQLQQIAAGGATPSGNYTINYNYSYAPDNCTGAIATVAYTQ